MPLLHRFFAARLPTPPLFWVLTLGLVLLSLLPTLWPQLDLAAAALFFPPHGDTTLQTWWWVEAINVHTTAAFRGMLYILIAGWLLCWAKVLPSHWRKPLACMVLAGALGPGLVVNAVFKDQWQRARPYQVSQFGGESQFTRAGAITDQCTVNCSFVSGHTACAYYFMSLLLLLRQRRHQVLCAGLGAALTVAVAFSRMAAGGHWLSDVLWAGPITLLCSWLVWQIVFRKRSEPPF